MTTAEVIAGVGLIGIALSALAAFVSKCIAFGMHERRIQELADEVKAYKEGWACPICEGEDAFQQKADAFLQADRAQQEQFLERLMTKSPYRRSH